MKNACMFDELASMYTGENKAIHYKEWFDTKDQDVVIAYIYTKNYYLFNQVTDKFIGLNEHTITDIIITQIWRCLEDYDETKSKGKMTTYICQYIRNACRNATQSENLLKNRINQRHISSLFCELEGKTEYAKYVSNEGHDNLNPALAAAMVDDDKEYNAFEIAHYLNQIDLSDNQRKFCEIVITGEDDIKMSDIAREMGISRAGVLGIKRQLQEKLYDLIA